MRISSDLPPIFGDPNQMNWRLQKMIRVAKDIVQFSLDRSIEDPLSFLIQVSRPDFDPSTLGEKAKQLAEEVSIRKLVNLDFFFQLDDY